MIVRMRIARRVTCDHQVTAESIVSREELRGAVRFPLSLPVVLETSRGEIAAVTRNISANGVLLELGQCLKAGTEMRYSLRMPGGLLGAGRDMLVHCTGRVVRCSLSQRQYLAAATIEDYRFAEQ
jgi:PilZ domain